MIDPPVTPGAVQETVLWPVSLEVALMLVGAPGTVDGVTLPLGLEEALVPTALVATTVKL